MYIDDGNSRFGFSFYSCYLFIFSYKYLLFHFNFVFKVGEYKIIMKYLNYNKLQFVRTYCAVYCRIMWIVYDCLFTKWNWIHLCEWICMAWSEVMPAGPIEWIVIQIQTKWIPIICRGIFGRLGSVTVIPLYILWGGDDSKALWKLEISSHVAALNIQYSDFL